MNILEEVNVLSRGTSKQSVWSTSWHVGPSSPQRHANCHSGVALLTLIVAYPVVFRGCGLSPAFSRK